MTVPLFVHDLPPLFPLNQLLATSPLPSRVARKKCVPPPPFFQHRALPEDYICRTPFFLLIFWEVFFPERPSCQKVKSVATFFQGPFHQGRISPWASNKFQGGIDRDLLIQYTLFFFSPACPKLLRLLSQEDYLKKVLFSLLRKKILGIPPLKKTYCLSHGVDEMSILPRRMGPPFSFSVQEVNPSSSPPYLLFNNPL